MADATQMNGNLRLPPADSPMANVFKHERLRLFWRSCLGCAAFLAAMVSHASAQILKHPNCHLDWIYPSGAQRGQTIEVEFGGAGGLNGATGIYVEGPGGLMVSDVKAHDGSRVTAKLTVAADAPLGRRMLRVQGGDNGLTNPRSFLIGDLHEIQEASDDQPASQPLTTPIVINGRLNPTTDVDRFQFVGHAGQAIVAAVLAHRIDVLKPHPQKDHGYLDVGLELLNDQSAVLAAADDTLGLDPLIHYVLPADGHYTVVIKGLSYHGFPSGVYRLLLGEVPYPTAIYPAGGQRGQTVDVEVSGVNIVPGTRVAVQVPVDDEFPLLDIHLPGAAAGNQFLPFACGSDPEVLEVSGPHRREQAQAISCPTVVNGRFLTADDDDWYSIELKSQESIEIEIVAERHLRSPIDSMVEVYNSAGRKLQENDDGEPFGHECIHDHKSVDSWVPFTAPEAGKYFIRLMNQSSDAGPRAVYRLSVRPHKADFALYQWPDVVPIWGANSTATFVVQEMHQGGFDGEIELRVEGLPPNWSAPATRVGCAQYKRHNNEGRGGKVLMSITAPADAMRGTIVPFRVVGKASIDGRTIEHSAQSLALLGNGHNDRMHLRLAKSAMAVVATELDCRLESSITELSGRPGETLEIPVTIERTASFTGEMGLTVDSETIHVACALQPPIQVEAGITEMRLPLHIPSDRAPGNYGIVVSRSWASDLRKGRPGPCTRLILLHVLPPEVTASK